MCKGQGKGKEIRTLKINGGKKMRKQKKKKKKATTKGG
jgi:hypothetical protein